jgi:peptidoglycan/xylan/chitin deacetylase (PgdA/CDA1 family)
MVPEALPPLERVLQKIRANADDITKYVEAGDGTDIIVKADITEGEAEYEVRYDLANAIPVPFLPTENPRYEVGFSLRDKQTGAEQQDRFQWIITPGDAGLLLSFDDDYMNVWENNFDLFDRYGAKITFFVQGPHSPFCARAQSRGHDIGYHTIHHLNLPLVSQDVFFAETVSEIERFRNDGVPLRAFAYPFGLSESWMLEALSGSFAVQRGYGVSFHLYTINTITGGYIRSRAIDNILFKKDEDFEALITIMLRTAKFTGGVLPLTTHDISDTADWGIKPERLEYLLGTARDLQLQFYRYSDF